MKTREEQELAIADIEKSLDRLQALYNQYFMGIERTEPLVPRKALDRKIHAIRRMRLRSTALKFRLQTQIQRYNTQSTFWRRICRQIEEGTYKPHMIRAQKRIQAAGRVEIDEMDMAASQTTDVPEALAALLGEDESPPVYEISEKDLGDFGLDDPFAENAPVASHPLDAIAGLDDPFAAPVGLSEPPAPPTPASPPGRPSVKPVAPPSAPRTRAPVAQVGKAPGTTATKAAARKPAPAKAPRRPTPATGAAGLDDAKLKKIYRTYLAAKKKCDEPTDKMSYDKVKKTLQKQFEAKGGTVDFKVIIRNGKAAIKTVKAK